MSAFRNADIVSGVAESIVGRDEELRSLRDFLDASGDEARALVIEGEAGIGKSTLFRAAVDEALERGFRVLTSRPAEAERGLVFAGLGDLFEAVLDEVLPSLPPPRRRALEIALLVEEATDPVDARALGVAVRSALDALASDAPVVLAIDDVQWLDPSSEDTLSFALRRAQSRLLLLLVRRLGDRVEPSQLERVLEPTAVASLHVGPLSVGAIQRLVWKKLGRALPRTTLLRIHEASGGNPFYALELARALGPDVDPTRPLSIPETLDALLRNRLDALPRQTHDALALVAAVADPQAGVLRRAGVTDDVLDPAIAAGIVERTHEGVRFTHPLLASSVEGRLSATARRGVHRELAQAVSDPVERARHLANSVESADADVAAAAEKAADDATARAAIAAAIELREHALRLTPVEAREDVHRRTLAAARAHLARADHARANALARVLLEGASRGVMRAEALVLLSDLASGPSEAIELRRMALGEAGDDLAMQADIHQALAWMTGLTEGADIEERHARAALALAERLNDDALAGMALSAMASSLFHRGRADALELGRQALERSSAIADFDARTEISLRCSSLLLWAGEIQPARVLLHHVLTTVEEVNEWSAGDALYLLAFAEIASGRLTQAAEVAERARDAHLPYGDHDDAKRFAVAFVAAQRGDLGTARELAEQGRILCEERNPWFTAHFEAVLGLVALTSGDARRALRRFEAAEEARRNIGSLEPNLIRWRADHVEALLELRYIDDAEALVDSWEVDAKRLGRTSVVAQVTRCRGLIALARGELPMAVTLLENAAKRHAELGDALGRARALLALGVARRRARQKRAAREAIEQALEMFENCGADGWAQKARAELGSIGGRSREEGLTAAERRVAALVAEGRTNREVAAALYLGERTVQTHLTHIYAKLGVRSRTELARKLGSAS